MVRCDFVKLDDLLQKKKSRLKKSEFWTRQGWVGCLVWVSRIKANVFHLVKGGTCILCFVFCILNFVFCILYFVFCILGFCTTILQQCGIKANVFHLVKGGTWSFQQRSPTHGEGFWWPANTLCAFPRARVDQTNTKNINTLIQPTPFVCFPGMISPTHHNSWLSHLWTQNYNIFRPLSVPCLINFSVWSTIF